MVLCFLVIFPKLMETVYIYLKENPEQTVHYKS